MKTGDLGGLIVIRAPAELAFDISSSPMRIDTYTIIRSSAREHEIQIIDSSTEYDR